MPRYDEEQKRVFVRQASKVAVDEIAESASVSKSRAQEWIRVHWATIRRVDSYSKLAKDKNDSKVKQAKFKELERSLDFYKQLLMDDYNQKPKRRDLAKRAVRRHGHSIAKACKLLNISEGYYRSEKED